MSGGREGEGARRSSAAHRATPAWSPLLSPSSRVRSPSFQQCVSLRPPAPADQPCPTPARWRARAAELRTSFSARGLRDGTGARGMGHSEGGTARLLNTGNDHIRPRLRRRRRPRTRPDPRLALVAFPLFPSTRTRSPKVRLVRLAPSQGSLAVRAETDEKRSARPPAKTPCACRAQFSPC